MSGLATVDTDAALVRDEFARMLAVLGTATPAEAAEIAHNAKDARAWLRIKKAATDLRVSAVTVECTALRRLGSIDGGPMLLAPPERATARRLAALAESEWTAFRGTLEASSAPKGALDRFLGSRAKERAANYTKEEIDRVRKEYAESGKPFTINDFREAILTKWAVVGDPESTCGKYRTAAEEWESLVFDDPYVIQGMNEVIRSALRATLHNELPYRSDGTAELVDFIAYFDADRGEWVRVHIEAAEPEQIRFAAGWRREQAAAINKVAADLEEYADSLDGQDSKGTLLSEQMAARPYVEQFRVMAENAVQSVHPAKGVHPRVPPSHESKIRHAAICEAVSAISSLRWPPEPENEEGDAA